MRCLNHGNEENILSLDIFPTLPIVLYHGYWPKVQQAIGLALRYHTIHLVPDTYLFLPGSEGQVLARQRLSFGSSYTFRPIGQSIEDAQRLGLKGEVLEQFFSGNAERLFGLA